MNSKFRERVEAFFQETLNEDLEEGEEPEYITKWVLVMETQALNGNKAIRVRKSKTPPWDALGMMEWAVKVFKETHEH